VSAYFCEWCERQDDELTPEEVKGLYAHVVKHGRFPGGVADVRHVERALRADIPSTAEFHRLVNDYLIKQQGTKLTDGQRLQRQRKRRGLTQSRLARVLGVKKAAVCHYESGKRPLSKEALEWLNAEKPLQGESLQK